jgi:hypothetical protein
MKNVLTEEKVDEIVARLGNSLQQPSRHHARDWYFKIIRRKRNRIA